MTAFLFPGSLSPWWWPRFFDVNGKPLALGTLSSFVAGTSTPLPTYSDPDVADAHANAVILTLGADGSLPVPIFRRPVGYKFDLKDALGASQPGYPVDNVLDVGQVFAENFGVYQFNGSKDVTSGYTIDPETDHFVTVASTGGPNPCVINLCPAANARWPLTIKNMGTVPLKLVPDGADTIDTVGSDLAIIPAAASPLFPSVVLLPDGISAWLVPSSHALWL